MKIALTVWENQISPVFDSARTLLIVNIENETIINIWYKSFRSELPHCKAAELLDLQIKVLICGAITQLIANMIEASNIRIIPFIAGDVNQVLEAYLKGILPTKDFRMPGC